MTEPDPMRAVRAKCEKCGWIGMTYVSLGRRGIRFASEDLAEHQKECPSGVVNIP
jgi:hypothetical protein